MIITLSYIKNIENIDYIEVKNRLALRDGIAFEG
jgi:hypothetical protein